MKIALIGYGKMGHAIEQAAERKGHTITARITSANTHEITALAQMADVAIEFTNPVSAKENILKCLAAGIPVVSGTTGWNNGLDEAAAAAKENDCAFLHASNFSIGVNLFFEVNKALAALMNGHDEYNTIIDETHHTQKKDAPSGTAITLAEQIIARIDHLRHWKLNELNDHDAVPIMAHRTENVPGTHRVSYTSAVDTIEIIHTAHNRDGFALGAVLAAEYIEGKKGVFTMQDVLGIK